MRTRRQRAFFSLSRGISQHAELFWHRPREFEQQPGKQEIFFNYPGPAVEQIFNGDAVKTEVYTDSLNGKPLPLIRA